MTLEPSLGMRVGLFVACLAVLAGAVVLGLRSKTRHVLTLDEARALAHEATDLLQRGLRVADTHAYYCGMGLAWVDGTFIYDAVQDGELASSDQVMFHGSRRRQFQGPEQFCEWLAAELLKHPPGPTSEISYWRLKSHVDAFKRSLVD